MVPVHRKREREKVRNEDRNRNIPYASGSQPFILYVPPCVDR